MLGSGRNKSSLAVLAAQRGRLHFLLAERAFTRLRRWGRPSAWHSVSVRSTAIRGPRRARVSTIRRTHPGSRPFARGFGWTARGGTRRASLHSFRQGVRAGGCDRREGGPLTRHYSYNAVTSVKGQRKGGRCVRFVPPDASREPPSPPDGDQDHPRCSGLRNRRARESSSLGGGHGSRGARLFLRRSRLPRSRATDRLSGGLRGRRG